MILFSKFTKLSALSIFISLFVSNSFAANFGDMYMAAPDNDTQIMSITFKGKKVGITEGNACSHSGFINSSSKNIFTYKDTSVKGPCDKIKSLKIKILETDSTTANATKIKLSNIKPQSSGFDGVFVINKD